MFNTVGHTTFAQGKTLELQSEQGAATIETNQKNEVIAVQVRDGTGWVSTMYRGPDLAAKRRLEDRDATIKGDPEKAGFERLKVKVNISGEDLNAHTPVKYKANAAVLPVFDLAEDLVKNEPQPCDARTDALLTRAAGIRDE
jgi:hypothetical protein